MFTIKFINEVSGAIVELDELTFIQYHDAITAFINNNQCMDWHIEC